MATTSVITDPVSADLKTLLRQKMIEAVTIGRELAATAPLRALGLTEIAPGPALTSDAELATYLRANAEPYPHLCGTAPMGPATATSTVVDHLGRVHGISGLRVVDASILPDAPSTGAAIISPSTSPTSTPRHTT